MKLYFILSFVVLFPYCEAFLPTNFGAKETDYTHKSITENAIYKASARYIAKFLKPGVYNDTDFNENKIIQDFFGHDIASPRDFKGVVAYLVYGNNNAQRQYGDNAIYTMNAEQIENGNLLLQNKRDTIIRMAKSPNPDWNFIRLTIGEYLMTLQMFYSNTNWVELKGIKVNTALGIRGKKMLPVAPSSMATCIDCNYTLQAILDGACENNLNSNGGYLTSGYKGGQHTTKPIGLWVGSSGKCSHGGSWDDTQSISARGGINKETSNPNLSPHFRLHEQAGEAAIEATVYFLVGNGTGLLDQLGPAIFGDMLNLHATCYNCLDPKLSLTFVIDNTGSMSDDIAAVRQTTVDIVNQAAVSGGVANYVLSTFNDPVTKNTIRNTTDGNVIKNWLQNLIASGGDDCPEFAMRGLLDGMKLSLPGSCVFFFTDADPKDPELETQVKQMARNKNIHLMLFLRGQCNGDIQGDNSTQPSCVRRNDRENVGSRRKRSLGGGGWGMFSSLVSSTSSSAVKVSNSAISKTIGDIIDNSVGINPIYIANLTMNSVSKNLKFPIDGHMKLFTIEAKGVSQSNIKLLHPDGTLETFSTNLTTIDNIGVAIVISAKTPIVGTWELQNTGGSTFEVIIKGKGNIDFTSQLMEKVGGIPFPISGSSPIAGSNVTVGLNVMDIAENDTVDKIILRSKTDDILAEKNINSNNKKSPRTISADFEVPSKPFRLTIQGTDKDGNKFRRTSKEMITPVTGNIDILPLADDLIKGIPANVYVNVTNAGSSPQTFTVVASDTQNYLQPPKQKTVTISSHHSETVTFKMVGTRKMSVTALTVELKMGYKSLQKKTRQIMVKNSVPPIFTTVTRSQNCSEIYMNNINCSLETWFTEVKVTCSQPCVSLNVPSSSAVSTHGALNRSGDITANISGNCCSADCKLVAVDSISNIVQLPIDFTGDHKVEIIKPSKAIDKKVDPPDVIIVGQSQNCTSDHMNSENCTHGTWWVSMNIVFEAAGSEIYLTPERTNVGDRSSANITHDDLKSMQKVIHTNISGTCCLYDVSLFAKDSIGQLSQRKLDFSGGTKFEMIISDGGSSKNSYDSGSIVRPGLWVVLIAVYAGLAGMIM